MKKLGWPEGRVRGDGYSPIGSPGPSGEWGGHHWNEVDGVRTRAQLVRTCAVAGAKAPVPDGTEAGATRNGKLLGR